MNIHKIKQDSQLTLALEGRLDTATAPELEACLNENIAGITALTFDMTGLEYISSAGLRVLLNTQKVMDKQGTMELIHVSESVRDVFALTGLLDILTVVS